MHLVKTFRLIYFTGLVFVFNLIPVSAQSGTQEIRNTDTISYYVNNPYGNMAEFTWTIAGGTIVGYLSPYTAVGADTIQVIWDNSNTSGANDGSLSVFEIINWPDGASCQSEEYQINIESWVQPKAITDTSGIRVCNGEPFVITINFEGKPEYQYKWKLYEKENPSIILEDYTTDFINSIDPSADIVFTGIENSSSTQKIYEFAVTGIKDGLDDTMPGNVSMARVTIYVQPKPQAGTMQSSKPLIRR